MIKDIVLVGIGSCLGGICRYLISLFIGHPQSGFPWGTFVVNIIGCLLIGILWGVTSRFQNFAQAFSLLRGRFLWRFHHLFHILKRGTGHATNQ